MQNDKHYHTIPADEWQTKWLPMEQEIDDLRRELERKDINVRLNRRHHTSPFWDEEVKVGYYEINVGIPTGLKIDKDLVKQILLDHESLDPHKYIYSEAHAGRVSQEIVNQITKKKELEARIERRINLDSRLNWLLAALLIANLIIVYYIQ